ncbi:lysylphosphatidylglycerol synthase domain-containing protein [Flavobacterium jejuense]|nr:lysylphosphatidylglycerol synthase domain-containing protein [Flavobacterium jejuense]
MPDKAKQFLLVILKLLVVSMALGYIYYQLQNKKIDWNAVSSSISFKAILILILFSITNWVLEIFKWQNLVSYFKEITFFESSKQSLGSLTASIFTPNRIGEYGAKILFYSKEQAKKILFLNFISNSSQMATTCFFGILGIILLSIKKTETMLWVHFKIKTVYFIFFILFILIVFLIIKYKKVSIYGFSIEKLIRKIKQFPSNIMMTNFQLSTMRYLVFSHQFYYLLVIFNCEIPYSTALSLIFTLYFIASLLPSIHFMDVAIKGGVAVYLFSKFDINEWKIVMITSIMWFFNLVIPVVIGSYFVLRFKPQQR